jgi:aubergine-like protein
VTRYKHKDFFLIPQNVNQGTVTPTHFVVVKENARAAASLGADDIQKLAYKLTHMYFNWEVVIRQILLNFLHLCHR